MAKKTRAAKYEEKVAIDATFEDIVKVMLKDPKKAGKKSIKKKAAKK